MSYTMNLHSRVERLLARVHRRRAEPTQRDILRGLAPTGVRNLPRMLATAGQLEAAIPPGLIPAVPVDPAEKPRCLSMDMHADSLAAAQPPKLSPYGPNHTNGHHGNGNGNNQRNGHNNGIGRGRFNNGH